MSVVTKDIEDPTQAHLSVMHIGAEEQAHDLAISLADRLGIPNPPVYKLPAAIGVHARPGTLAVGFFVSEAKPVENYCYNFSNTPIIPEEIL